MTMSLSLSVRDWLCFYHTVQYSTVLAAS